jgi:opacity protein-like surface antigen
MPCRTAPFGLSVLVALLATTAAFADDLQLLNAPEIDVSQSTVAQSWYFRGDLGYAGWMRGDEPEYRSSTLGVRHRFDTSRFSNPVSYGLGVGYQFNDTSRFDLTADFFGGDLSGRSDLDVPCSGAEAAGTRCGFKHKADYSAINVMANGYVDLGTVAGFTPYVGVGLGATHVRWDALASDPSCIDGASACSGDDYARRSMSGDDSWRFTYALMAGASVDLTDRVKFDFGYRFSDVAGGRMSNEPDGFGGGAEVEDEGFQKHELRAGLRFTIW